MTESYFKQI